jgi:hypothetical protein
MFERGFSVADVKSVLESGRAIEEYPEDHPLPSRLVLGFVGRRPMHVVAANDEEANETIIITAYEPSSEEWDEGFTKRRA